jgi:hypothetical protein
LNKLQAANAAKDDQQQTSTQLELKKTPNSMVHHSKKTPKDIAKAVEDGGSYMTSNFVGNHTRTSSQNNPSSRDHATKTLLAAAAVEDQRNNFEVAGHLPRSAKATGNLVHA